MNFQSLKVMIDNLIQTYQCPSCESSVDDTSVEVVGTAGSNINVEVECPGCGKHSIVRAQVFSLDLPSSQLNEQNLEELKLKLSNKIADKQKNSNTKSPARGSEKNINSIKDSQIISLNKVLKEKNISIDQLFGE